MVALESLWLLSVLDLRADQVLQLRLDRPLWALPGRDTAYTSANLALLLLIA